MKRYFVCALAVFSALGLGAQNYQDALNFGQTNYVGSAYSIAMGNAVTALGGDLGTIGINPAGSAVAGYSQFTITPGVNISLTDGSYRQDPFSEFGSPYRSVNSQKALPNIGLSMRAEYDDPYSSLKSITLAFVSNTTQNYLQSFSGSGIQATEGINHKASSKFAELAYWATRAGLTPEAMNGNNIYYNSDYNSYWDVIMGWQAGLFSQLADFPGQYVGCTELLSGNNHFIPGSAVLNQDINVIKSGSRSDLIFNMAFDFDHKYYLGINLGLPVGSYTNMETITESGSPMESFPIVFTDGQTTTETFFKSATYRYCYTSSFSGVYFKVGGIANPVAGLRLGFALQTPTIMTISEQWWHSGRSEFANGQVSSATSLKGDYTYDFSSPFIMNLGVAYTFGTRGLISVDYELQDFSSMEFAQQGYWDDDYAYYEPNIYTDTNAQIASLCRASHNLRVGAELNITPQFSLRAGYNLYTCAEREYNDLTQAYSCGFGYKSRGPLFADFAIKYTSLPGIIFTPYGDYDEFYAPDVLVSRSLVNAALTLGWRF